MSAPAPDAAKAPLDVVRGWYATRNPELLAEDIAWSVTPGFPEAGDVSGRRAVLEGFFPRLLARFSAYGAHPAEMLAASERVIVIGEYRGAAKASGVGFTSRFVHVWTVRDGRIASFWQVADTVPVQAALDGRGRAETGGRR